jgi:hypothetical protein
MFPHFVNLLCRSWYTLVRASSTSTLGFFLWTIGITVIGWAATVAANWFDLWRAKHNQPFRKALARSVTTGTFLAVLVLVFVAVTYAYFLMRTVYDDHQHLAAENRQFAESGRALRAEVQWRKHNISTTDPVFPNLIYLLQTFSMYRQALKGQPCVIVITAPSESRALAGVVASFSNSVSNCFTFGPMDTAANPDVENETMTGMVADMVVFHAARDDNAANQLFNNLANQIRLKRSYQLPRKNEYSLAPGVGPVHVVWLQFGTNSKWNSELR